MPELPVTYYTTPSGPGVSDEQPIPSESIGGYAATTIWGSGVQNDLYGKASEDDVNEARASFRCVYLYNPDITRTLSNIRAYVTPRTTGGAGLAVGADPRPASYIDSLSLQAVEIATVYSIPSGVTFGNPANYIDGIELGNLPPKSGRAVWFRRVPLGTAGAPNDSVDVTFETSDAISIVRRIYWETEPYAERTRQTNPPNAIPTPSPFRRVEVDFLTIGGSRVIWNLDSSVQDVGPYVFQLQFSHSGIADESDWIDVGPPVEDAPYLLDPEQRLWGMSLSTSYYRVILTTASSTYTSAPAPVFGILDARGWSMVHEILRKEELMLRQFVGLNGFLLRAKRYGTRCSCVDPVTREIRDSSHLECYGTGIVGGFYKPIPLKFANPSNQKIEEKVAYNEGLGTTRPITISGRMTATVPIASRDVWVAEGEDDRYYVHRVDEISTYRSTPIVLNVQLRLAPRSDIIQQLVLMRPADPPVPYRTCETLSI